MLNINTYQQRRQQLLGYLSGHTAMLIPAALHYPRNWDSEYYYDQDADFYYLTGFDEPETLLLLLPGHADGEVILFCRANDPLAELWTGARMGLAGVKTQLGVDLSYDIASLNTMLPKLLLGRQQIYYPLNKYDYLDKLLLAWVSASRQGIRRGEPMVESLHESRTWIRQMRAVKNEAEIACMQQAMNVSMAAHQALMQQCKPQMYEYELEALFAYRCRAAGADALLAYDSIVAGGANACVLHYHQNEAQLNDGELLLVDAGCRVDHYTSDITRTYPINGKFSDAQRRLYEVVLTTQETVIKAVKPGLSLNDLQQLAIALLTQGLHDLEILSGDVSDSIETGAYKAFYPHLIGHWLGLDTHDPSEVRQGDEWVQLVPGVVLTVEPGLYIPVGTEGVDPIWHGIGVRIEDNILVTENGYQLMTAGLGKTVAEIEAIMQD